MASELRRSFKEKAKEKLTFTFRANRRSNPDVSAASPDDSALRGRPLSEPSSQASPLGEPPVKASHNDPMALIPQVRSKPDNMEVGPGEAAPRTEKCRSIHLTQPKGTISYEAGGRDTLASIAAQFDTTTSELKKLNKLMTTMVFPGQMVYVPDKDYIVSEGSTPSSPTVSVSPGTMSPTLQSDPAHPLPPTDTRNGSTSPHPTDSNSEARAESKTAFDLKLMRRPKGPGLAERQKSTELPSPVHIPHPSGEEARRLVEELTERFIKVSVKHITDGQGVVSGVLLVTPNAIMFDPNVSDPLVVDRGAEEYGMIAPMDTIISAAMYHDIAAMNKQHRILGTNGGKPPAVYHDRTCPLYQAEEQEIHGGRPTSPEAGPTSPEAMPTSPGARPTSPEASSIFPGGARSISPAPLSPGSLEHRGLPRNESVCSCKALDVTQPLVLKHQHSMSAASVVRASTRTPTEGFTSNKWSIGLEEIDFTEAPETDQELTSVSEKDTVTNTINKNANVAEDRITKTSEGSCGVDSSDLLISATNKESEESRSDTLNGYNMFVGDKALSPHSYGPPTSISAGTTACIPADSPQHALGGVTVGGGTPSEAHVDSPSMGDNSKEKGRGGATSALPLMLSPPAHADNVDYFPQGSESLRRSPSPQRDDLSVPRDACGSPRPSSSPKDHGLLTRTLESLSSLGSSFPGSPNLTSLTAGLFSWSEPGVSAASLLKGQSLDESDVFSEGEQSASERDSTKPEAAPQQNYMQRLQDLDVQVENIVKFTDKPELFKDLSELLPRPATHYEDLPLYLCLRVGLPSNKQVSKTCPIESYMKHKHKPEYWFCIPRDKVDPLYAFFLQWSPSIYGSDDQISAKDRGFVVVNENEMEEEPEQEDMGIIDDHFDKRTPNTRQMTKDWEIVNLEEARRRLSYAELEHLALPELSDKSTILTEAHIRRLVLHLPARAESYPWTLIYSSEKHGFSLKTLYRTMQKIDSPIMIAIKDTNSQVFGAMLPCAIILSDHFYGTGESYLFTFYQDFMRYGWSGSNSFFIKGNAESLAIGSGKGSFGLWLDGDLYHGRTQCCETYNNDILTESEDFVVKTLEAWGFV